MTGENAKCLSCWKCLNDGEDYCELSCKNISEYDGEDKCKNRMEKWMGEK